MSNRLTLHDKFCEILASRNVYFQPPESIRMNYPAIIYSLANLKTTFANNGIYAMKTCYKVVVIDKNPDSVIPEKILRLPFCSFDRSYVADNLNHYVFTLYF